MQIDPSQNTDTKTSNHEINTFVYPDSSNLNNTEHNWREYTTSNSKKKITKKKKDPIEKRNFKRTTKTTQKKMYFFLLTTEPLLVNIIKKETVEKEINVPSRIIFNRKC